MTDKRKILGGLALAGLLGALWAGRRGGDFGFWLAAVHAPDWLGFGVGGLRRLRESGFSGIDIRIRTPDTSTTAAERQLAELCRAAGLRVRAHGWQGVRDGADGPSRARYSDGVRQGQMLCALGRELGAELCSGNFERDVWRGRDGLAHPFAHEYLRGHAAGYLAERTSQGGPARGDLGFADPTEHYKAADGNGDGVDDRLLPSDILSGFARRGVMAYGQTFASVAPRLERARRVSAALPLTHWSSVGRVDSTGAVIGSADTTRQVAAQRPGGIDEWCGYVGFGAIRQVFEGHAKHPSLAAIVGDLTGGRA